MNIYLTDDNILIWDNLSSDFSLAMLCFTLTKPSAYYISVYDTRCYQTIINDIKDLILFHYGTFHFSGT
jgi:hypothetical protein